MLFIRIRRRFRNRFVKFLITFGSFLIILFIIRFESNPRKVTNLKNGDPRLFCVLLNTHSTHERFIYINNITWGKRCYKIGIVRYRRLSKSDEEAQLSRIPYHVNLWIRILDVTRQSISPYEAISNNDSLIIVPAPTYVFREKIFSLLHTSINNSQLPLIIIHEQQEANSYIFNGQALNLLRNTELIDLCLQQSYPSAREKHLWKCIQTSLQNEYKDKICENMNCFIQYHSYQLTLGHIKNGFCLENNHHMCQTIPLFYPSTFNDFITLEFFKYKLKSKSSDDLL